LMLIGLSWPVLTYAYDPINVAWWTEGSFYNIGASGENWRSGNGNAVVGGSTIGGSFASNKSFVAPVVVDSFSASTSWPLKFRWYYESGVVHPVINLATTTDGYYIWWGDEDYAGDFSYVFFTLQNGIITYLSATSSEYAGGGDTRITDIFPTSNQHFNSSSTVSIGGSWYINSDDLGFVSGISVTVKNLDQNHLYGFQDVGSNAFEEYILPVAGIGTYSQDIALEDGNYEVNIQIARTYIGDLFNSPLAPAQNLVASQDTSNP